MMKILPSEITPYKNYINRRKFIKSSVAAGVFIGASTTLKASHLAEDNPFNNQLDENDKLNTFEDITTYNNFYEFGMGKTDPSENSSNFNPKPWSISLEGLINNPKVLDLEKILNKVTRIFRRVSFSHTKFIKIIIRCYILKSIKLITFIKLAVKRIILR